MQNYLGIDIGGMTVKGLLIAADGSIIADGSVETQSEAGAEKFCANTVSLINRLKQKSDCAVAGVGVGCPGLIDSANGRVVFAGNLNLKDYPLAENISAQTGLSVKVTNDANAAALGEAKFGAGSKYKNSLLITLGTGVGCGIIIDGKLFEGGGSAGAELGHTVIVKNGLKCTCGRRGCLEMYASASALTKQTKKAMKADRDSAMWGGYDISAVNGKTAFEYMDKDSTAKKVVEKYVEYLACGIINAANVFRPEVIMLGGGVSGQGEKLTKPLQEILDEQIFAGCGYAPVKIVKASLGSKAGAFGAAALFM